MEDKQMRCWSIDPGSQHEMVTVRALRDRADCERVVELTASAFPEEVRGSGLTASWRDLELEDLLRQQWCWPSIGEAAAWRAWTAPLSDRSIAGPATAGSVPAAHIAETRDGHREPFWCDYPRLLS